MKKYFEIKLPNKDILVILTYSTNSDAVRFMYCFNSISNTYMGLKVEAFTNTIRGLLRQNPTFFEQLEESDYRNSFKDMGFERKEPTPEETKLYTLIYS